MPSRGNYWRKGGLPDGTVTQDEIDEDYKDTIEGGGGGGGHTIEEETTPLTDRSALNFQGNAVVATDNAGTDASDITINKYIVKNEVGSTLAPVGDPPSISFGGGLRGVNDEGGTVITNDEPAHVIKEEGASLPARVSLDFTGAGVSVADGPGENTTVTIPNIYDTIEDDGTPLTQRPTLNFTGVGFTATDDGEDSKTRIDFLHDGRYVKLATVTIGSELPAIDAVMSESMALYSEVVAYVVTGVVSTVTKLGWQINNETTGYSENVLSWDNTGVTTGSPTDSTSWVIPGATAPASSGVDSTLRLTRLRTGVYACQIHTNSQSLDPSINYGLLSGASSSISSIKLTGLGGTNFQSGSFMEVYGIKRT